MLFFTGQDAILQPKALFGYSILEPIVIIIYIQLQKAKMLLSGCSPCARARKMLPIHSR
jgi:hypothetical protein